MSILALALPVWKPQPAAAGDWLIGASGAKATASRSRDGRELVLSNGLIARRFRLTPDAATIGFDNLVTGESLLRAVKPEAVVKIDGKVYEVGGLKGQPDLAFLRPDWIEGLKASAGAFHLKSLVFAKPLAPIEWKRVRHSPDVAWPPPGVKATLAFANPSLPGIVVELDYELYDGMPVMMKRLRLRNGTRNPVRLESYVVERLGLVEAESAVGSANDQWLKQKVDCFSDYSFDGSTVMEAIRTTFWEKDPEYTTQVSYDLQTPCVLESRLPYGPDVEVGPGADYNSFRSYLVVHDSYDRERQGLAIRKLFRAMAPWSGENPIMLHLTSTEDKTVKTAMDQAAECGFEMVIFSFGSGLDMEDVSASNIARYKAYADYAHSKGLQVGGYSLLASRRIDDENDVINPKTGKTGGAIFGNSPCLGSKWGIAYFQHIKTFLEKTGFDLLEHDGSYPGDRCASTTHPGHRGLADSQWTQWMQISEFYAWCRSRGIYLNVPDWYLLAGSNKTGMGYRETNWSLPRDQQHVHARQNLFDGTWTKSPSVGWMFVPLVEYQGGGAAATIEPLHEHLADYEMHLANNFGFGAQACYRGPRLYDTPETKAAVQKWVSWFKKHREILESEVIHVRRADGQSLDCILHVNPALPERALAMVYNPTDHEITQEFRLPLYYSGLTEGCTIAEGDGTAKAAKLGRDFGLAVTAKVGAHGCAWFIIGAGSGG